MRNILIVVRERDIAYNLLETGKTGEPTPQIRYDFCFVFCLSKIIF